MITWTSDEVVSVAKVALKFWLDLAVRADCRELLRPLLNSLVHSLILAMTLSQDDIRKLGCCENGFQILDSDQDLNEDSTLSDKNLSKFLFLSTFERIVNIMVCAV